jgi:hypothetical protein
MRLKVAFIVLGVVFGSATGAFVTWRSATKQIADLTNQISSEQHEVTLLTQQKAFVTQERDALAEKFQRRTILYDGEMFSTRRWEIPADVQPRFIGSSGQPAYTHYDPKSQVETVKIAARN